MDYEKAYREQQHMLASMAASIAGLTQQNAKLVAKVDELTDMLAKKLRRRKRTPAKPVVVSDLSNADIADRPSPPALPPKPERQAKTGYRTGRKPLPEHLDVVSKKLTPTACKRCGGTSLRIVDQVVSEKLTHVRAHVKRAVTTRVTCACNECLTRTTAVAPPAPYSRSKVDSAFLAWLCYQKYGLHLPLDRIRRELRDQGVVLAESFLVSLIERAAGLLEGVDGAHWKQLMAGPHLHTDGSGLPVVVPKAGTHRGVVDVFAWDEIAVFQYATRKNGADLAAKLTGFSGTLVADAESRLNRIYAELDVLEAGCNAHGRRKFRNAEGAQPELAAEGGQFIAAVYAQERLATEQGLTGPDLLAHRQAHHAPIVADFRQWLDVLLPKLLPSDPLAKAARYYDNHWTALTRFLTDPSLPLDNNLSERLLRPLALGRNNWMFAGSTEGAHRAMVLMGIVATCRRTKVDPVAYMAWAFDRLGTRRKRDGHTASGSTPAIFRKKTEQ